jgi:hypothetical protein
MWLAMYRPLRWLERALIKLSTLERKSGGGLWCGADVTGRQVSGVCRALLVSGYGELWQRYRPRQSAKATNTLSKDLICRACRLRLRFEGYPVTKQGAERKLTGIL